MRLSQSWPIGILLIISIFTLISPAQTISTIHNPEFNPKETNVDTLEKTYSFNTPSIQRIDIQNKTFSSISINGLPNVDDAGMPLLPSMGSYLLIPPNKNILDISIIPSDQKTFTLNHKIQPGEVPIQLNDDEKPNVPAINSSIYQSVNPYPSSLYSEIGTYVVRGYPILILRLHPIQYHPLKNTISFYDKLTVSITFETQPQQYSTLRNKITDLNYVKTKIDNPLMIQNWKDSLTHINVITDESFDVLILTTNEFKEEFMELKEFHESQGFKTQIHTLTTIKPLNPDSVTPDDIRAYIKTQYIKSGIDYVLLGGDTEQIPAKMLYVHGMDEGKNPMETTMPADFFYGNLDGPFNYDDDSREGEPTDGTNGGDIDLFAEVFIGRASCDTKEDVQRFITKTISYQSLPSTNQAMDNILMAGEYLGNYGIASWGGNYLDLLLNESSADEYTTIGIPTDEYDIIKLYDRDLSDHWSPETLISLINENVHIINHDGHSYYGYNMRSTNDEIAFMENSFPFFVYSIGCMAGGFDNPEGYDCFAEHVTVKTENGAFAALMNARYGFFWSYSTDGDGTRYTREFWDAVFGEHIPCISKAHQDSREDNVYLIDRSCMRWTFYGLNLFADPTVLLRLGKFPGTPSLTGPSELKVDENAVFEVETSDEDSTQVFYLFDWDDGSTSGWIGPVDVTVPCIVNHSWSEKGSYTVRVKAKDETGLESPWATQPIETPYNKQTNDVFSFFQWIFSLFSHYFIQ